MTLKLLGAAALAAALAVPAVQARAQHDFGSGTRWTHSPDARAFERCADGDRHRARTDARFGCPPFLGGWAYADGEWALYNNRGWDPDSYNDWWNDRPDRAFPRWVQEQHARGTCDPDRMWWSGSGWHC